MMVVGGAGNVFLCEVFLYQLRAMFLSGLAAKSEACLDAGQARLPFESLHRKKPGGIQAQLHAGRSGLAS